MRCEIRPPDEASLAWAGQLIRSGGLVAFPTETVYGLGASACDESAILHIYEVKGRPQDNPLIVHTDDVAKVDEIGVLTPLGRRLLEAFMPGPLTLVLPRRPHICARVSAGLDTVAVRVPVHPAARAFLRAAGVPVAAPSANSSTRPSPTCAEHVLHDLGDKIPLILDGGPCRGGIESTVVDATGENPRILRPGLITREMIERVARVDETRLAEAAVRSPGVKYKHYAPKCPVKLFRHGDVALLQRRYDEAENAVFLCCAATAARLRGDRIVLGETEEEIARSLYGALLQAEQSYALVLLEACPEGGLGASVNNRMFKTGGSRYEEDRP